MSRIAIPAKDASPSQSRPLLDAVERQLGSVPNLFRLVGNSPAALEGYLGLSGALGKTLDAKTRERIALAVAETNGCDYCLSAHAYLGEHLAKLSPEEIALARDGGSSDARAAAAVAFAKQVAEARGKVSDDALARVRAAGYRDSEIIEIVGHVALNFLTNIFNNVAKTDIDFPVVAARKAA